MRALAAAIGLVVGTSAFAAEVPLTKLRGVYTVPVRINGTISLDFIVDSGAAEVNVPADVALTLMRAHTISESDFLPGATYILADGTEVQSPRFILRSIQIGNHVLTNVPASIGEIASRLLLGQSVLERLGAWSMDTRRGVLSFATPDGGAVPTPDRSTPSQTESAARPLIAPAPGPAATLTPVDTVRRFYGLIGAKQYWDAWTMLTEDYRTSIRSDFGGWVAGHRTTRSVEVTSAAIADTTSDSATVSFDLQSTDALDSGEVVTKAFHGTWILTRGDAGWALAKPRIREVTGAAASPGQ